MREKRRCKYKSNINYTCIWLGQNHTNDGVELELHTLLILQSALGGGWKENIMFVPVYHPGSSCRYSLNRKHGGAELSDRHCVEEKEWEGEGEVFWSSRKSNGMFLIAQLISPVGTLNETWRLINKVYTGFPVRKFGENHVGQITAKDCTVTESL
jgi:hypothetical protein